MVNWLELEVLCRFNPFGHLLAPGGHINALGVYARACVHTYRTCMRLRFIAQFDTHQEKLPKFESI